VRALQGAGAAGARAAAKLRPGALHARRQPIYQARGLRALPRQTGYQGRTGIHELLVLDETMRSAILQGTTPRPADNPGAGGMLTLYDDGLRKVAAGVTSLDEVLRVTQDQGDA
jgi:general secretion pathway protein E